MAEIISASEAAFLSNKTNSSDIQQELATVENMIKSAVKNGEFEIWVATNKFCKKTYEQLEKANYKVQCGFGGNRKTRISWGHLLNNTNTRTIETISDKALEFCDQCGAEVEIDPNDLREGWLGAYYFTCPVCGNESMDCTIETDLPTKDSIEFPKHFTYTCTNNAIDISNEEIQKVIRELANKLWDKTNERDYVSTGYGNMAVFIENYAGDCEYKITVCKDYWEGSIKANPADDYYGGD